jgi:LysR family hydrogen peroxide-inducible transcriptional activator
MLKPLPSLRQLRYLVALADHQNFSRAAVACLATQSTLSASLMDLEALLGVTLVERTRRKVLITPLGQTVVERARAILDQAEAIYDLAQASKGAPLSGPVRLGIIPTIAPFVLPTALSVLRDRYPQISLYLREDLTARLLDRLAVGELDAILIALPYPLEGMETFDLAEDGFVCAMTADHPLASKPQITPDDMAQTNVIMLEEGHCLRDHALAACPLSPTRSNAAIGATSLGTLVQMVRNGLGITVLPKIAVAAGILAGTGLITRPLAGQPVTRTLALAWRASSVRKADFILLGEAIRDGLPGVS